MSAGRKSAAVGPGAAPDLGVETVHVTEAEVEARVGVGREEEVVIGVRVSPVLSAGSRNLRIQGLLH